MRECRHHLDPDVCELCQEHIRDVAARLGARGAAVRMLALSPQRRHEIARLAAQKRWAASAEERKKAPRRKAAQVAHGKWATADTKNNRIRAALRADPERRTSDIAKELDVPQSMVSNLRTAMGLPRQSPPVKQPLVITRADLDADPEKLALARRIQSLTHRGYTSKRIAQMLDLQTDLVRAMVAMLADPDFKMPRSERADPISEEDLERAYQMWKEGRTHASIANALGRKVTQVNHALLRLLRSLGEK
jgi:DNA topoisomerase VI subunit B